MTVNIAVYEDAAWTRLIPLVYTRPACQLICGMTDLLRRVADLVSERDRESGRSDSGTVPIPAADESEAARPAIWCREMLKSALVEELPNAVNEPIAADTLLLNGRGLWLELPETMPGDPAWVGTDERGEIVCILADEQLANRLTPEVLLDAELSHTVLESLPRREIASGCVRLLDWPWDFVNANEAAIRADWERRAEFSAAVLGRVHSGTHLLGNGSIHIGIDSEIKPSVVIDAEKGPVWIGDNVTVLPHCYIEGPAFIGDGTLVQPGAIIHAGTTIGRRCKVGGEIESSIIHGLSNKQHNGFLGHSYIGMWVNIAADCINSDLKNTYGPVRVPIGGQDVDTGCQFVGMFMGDHSKAGINVSFPTGAVIGFCSNVMTSRSPKCVPSFTWIDGDERSSYETERGIEVAGKVMRRRQHVMTDAQKQLFFSVRDAATTLERHDLGE